MEMAKKKRERWKWQRRSETKPTLVTADGKPSVLHTETHSHTHRETRIHNKSNLSRRNAKDVSRAVPGSRHPRHPIHTQPEQEGRKQSKANRSEIKGQKRQNGALPHVRASAAIDKNKKRKKEARKT